MANWVQTVLRVKTSSKVSAWPAATTRISERQTTGALRGQGLTRLVWRYKRQDADRLAAACRPVRLVLQDELAGLGRAVGRGIG